ncbi:MAG: gliding motility-associated C-terminal domain-containing protein [Candidatus Pedobacter colombiensis]|uniref:Gliding motility-associated C-terminal domain-containing protein n=1 Tax=Candidatus Pedobacter colombiensis TaxID=3121371 RepID=A0AAJ5W8Y2_9SPHI|nr:gliding motility-associated C-terminal domain-containing protein [Pedobacter sp.]WEK20256.1 MAG: gliding motility-associated C-terminal domain-containing protein [Pedobacter sp.]
MRYWLFFIFILFAVVGSKAQSVGAVIVNSAGNTYTQKDITYEWSVGELALVETMLNKQVSITNGLLQPIVSNLNIAGAPLVFPINILTPNGDGVNDVWVVKDIEKFPDNEVTVFDRSGRTVFQTKNYQNDWAGYLSGRLLAEGTYYYVIKLKRNAKFEIIKGFITILN